ncbi:MAG: hypothetical protein HGA78_05000 [Nitrospirales bacterium]|nr:hypothetical protein [Nitrospirales bacterium]
MTIRLVTLVFSVIILLTLYAGRGGAAMGDCAAMLGEGRYNEAISASRSALRNERWDTDAQACLVIASYLKGRKEWAVRTLKEADDSLPKEVLDGLHDRIWGQLPELLAEKEYKDNFTMKGGSCLLRNVTALKGSGELLIGEFFNPLTSTTNRHARGFRCDGRGENCMETDLVCSDCLPRKEEARIVIRDYEVKDVRILAEGVELSRNVRYIKKILELEKEK